MALRLTHWEYSFHLHTCNLGESARTGTNPFTGQTVEVPIDEGLSDAEIDAIQAVFDENGIEGPEPAGEGYAVYGANSDSLRFRCNDLDEGEPISGIDVEVVVTSLSDKVLATILEVARAGNLAMTSSLGDCVRIIDRVPDRSLLERWPDAQTLSSATQLRQWLQGIIGGDQVHVPSC